MFIHCILLIDEKKTVNTTIFESILSLQHFFHTCLKLLHSTVCLSHWSLCLRVCAHVCVCVCVCVCTCVCAYDTLISAQNLQNYFEICVCEACVYVFIYIYIYI